MAIVDKLMEQLDEVWEESKKIESYSRMEPSGLADGKLQRIVTRQRAVIRRVAGRPSVYVDQCEEIVKQRDSPEYTSHLLTGVVDSLRADVAAGYLESYQERIHGELFGDFLEMAEYYLGEGQKEAAATIGGGALEAHLRQLCVRLA